VAEQSAGGLERLILRVERLGLTFRFTFAFHAREIRFECDRGDGFTRIFPETFAFRVGHHDPAELLFQLEDLLNRPELLSPLANRRDAEELVVRLLTQVPRYLGDLLADLENRLEGLPLQRVQQDVALFCEISGRFLESRDLSGARRVRVALMLMQKLTYRALDRLVRERVEPAYLEQFIRGDVDPVDPSDDPSDSGFFHTMESGEPDAVNRMLLRNAERAFYIWLEGTCLDEENRAFEKEDSPFDDRETEVMRTICVDSAESIERSSDLVPYLRRNSRDCRRLLDRLERWFLRRYDIRASSALIYHEASLDRPADRRDDTTLSWHQPRNHAIALMALASPFVAAIFLYDQYPRFFNLACSADLALVNAATIWFLGYRFCWKRELSFFHAAVPRIGAGIIVGYLPVFLIDEVWDLASQSFLVLGAVSLFLGVVTLLYIYVEVQRRLSDTDLAFARARSIFLLGVLQAFGIGFVMTNLVGHFMILRNWTTEPAASLAELANSGLTPFVGELPRIIGVEPFLAFPSAVLVMTFLSFFIGVFLQLMWEELPITEPL
jgi:hypothetical protein